MNDYNSILSDNAKSAFGESMANILKIVDRKTEKISKIRTRGKITAVNDSAIHACLPGMRQGQLCMVEQSAENDNIIAEVTAVRGNDIVLQAYQSSTVGISCDNWIIPLDNAINLLVGEYLKGAIVDGLGNILSPSADHDKLIPAATSVSMHHEPPEALSRPIIKEKLSMGVKSIDTLLTVGKGQRMGIFAPAGVGKSTLLAMMARFATADIIVLCLIGERGREVNEFLEMVLGEDARKKCVVVVSTSDRPAIEKVKAIYTATRIAEYFRDQGKDVLLMADSLTRFARAQRDISIASGEHIPPNGYPASVFSQLPLLLERPGQSTTGSITAFYTVLVENEQANDIVAEEVRSILDGHLILSRKLAASNQYPAIDVLASISRVMPQITSGNHQMAAGKLRNLLAKYQELELLIRVGEYQEGEDREADEAIKRHSSIIDFLKQATDEHIPFDQACYQLASVTGFN